MLEAIPCMPVNDVDPQAEIARLRKIIRVLMDRAERSVNAQGTDFSLFQTSVMLEEQVRLRTAELEDALRDNEKINRALRESEARFRALASQSMVGIAIIEHGKFTYSNDKFNRIFGYEAAEILQMGPRDLAADRAMMEEILHTILANEVDQIERVSHGLHKKGYTIDVEVRGCRMEIGGKTVVICVIMDVTERVRAERELRALQEALREQSTHDGLTGLYNRRYLDETFARELIKAQREGGPISIIMADLDHFKKVNDLYGHLAGDEVLRAFGGLLKRNSRSSDIFCRYGGEEFLLVFPGMTEAAALERTERLRSAIAATPMSFGRSQIAVTSSFGVAMFPRCGRTADALIAAADRALYAAKAAGRNRVVLSQEAVSPSEAT
jgi:diguanylate cyclase (GGDEF)-like protein/PAS domain S-box-containing protein